MIRFLCKIGRLWFFRIPKNVGVIMEIFISRTSYFNIKKASSRGIHRVLLRKSGIRRGFCPK